METKITIDKVLRIPEQDIDILNKLIKEKNWLVLGQKELDQDLDYLISKKTINPPLSEQEIALEVHKIRHRDKK